MSRIGKKYITMPQKVKGTLEKQKIFVDGPKGSPFFLNFNQSYLLSVYRILFI